MREGSQEVTVQQEAPEAVSGVEESKSTEESKLATIVTSSVTSGDKKLGYPCTPAIKMLELEIVSCDEYLP